MSTSDSFRARWRKRPRKTMISVHRGLWGPLPENSLAAVEAAARLGIVEVDIQLASDGVPVVMHDDTLDRMTGLAARVAKTASDVIAAQTLLEGDGGQNARPTTERVPLFSGLLANAPRNAFFDFDVKHPHEVEVVAAFLAGEGAGQRGSLKIDTYTTADIAHLRDLERRYGLMVMAKVVLPKAGLDHIAKLAEAGVAAAEVWFDDLAQLSEACAIAGDRMAISTYTLDPVHCCGLSDSLALKDPAGVWGRLVDAGVSIIMTDKSTTLERFLDTL